MINYNILLAIIIILSLLIFAIYNKKEPFKDSKNKKGLLCLYGESFRDGPNNDRTKGTEKGYTQQMIACDSHIKFLERIKSTYNIDMEILITTYYTKYMDDLKNKYKNYKVYFHYENKVIGVNNILKNGLKKTNIIPDKYEFIVLTRNDIYLRNNFINDFKIQNDKVLFTCQEWTKQDCFIDNVPRINPIIIYIPKKFNHIIKDMSVDHDGFKYLKKKYKLLKNEIGLMLNTYHASNSSDDYNPYYYMVGRIQNFNWFDKFTINNYNESDEIKCYNSNVNY